MNAYPALGAVPMPPDFKYKTAFLKGRPQHRPPDPFRLKHPAMDPGHRAKLFSPFDALDGFSDLILKTERDLRA